MDFSRFETVRRTGSDITDELRKYLAPFVAGRFGRPVRELFQEVAEALPLTMRVLETHYASPVLCAARGRKRLVPCFVFEGPGRNVFGSTHLPDFYELGYFRPSVGALPPAMQSLYVVTDALQVTSMNHPEIRWMDMPTPIAGRYSLEDYCELRNYDQKAPSPMVRAFGAGTIHAWMIGSRGDALFVNSASTSGRLYHVLGDDFAHFYTIPEPDSYIDRFCAHVLAAHGLADFDFRAD